MDERMMSEIAATWALLDATAEQQRKILDEAIDLAVTCWEQTRDPRFLNVGRLISSARAKLEVIDELRLPF